MERIEREAQIQDLNWDKSLKRLFVRPILGYLGARKLRPTFKWLVYLSLGFTCNISNPARRINTALKIQILL